jgi:ParB family chromosome partitioning protein
MPETSGHIELERNIDSIVIGVRHRIDLGDLGPLMKSIQRVGLLQPITITPDGLLVCGRRRLEAVKRLGWRSLKVWVRSGISDELSRLLAQRDDNELRKPLSPVEQAALYEELKKLLAEDAARRQEASAHLLLVPPPARVPELPFPGALAVCRRTGRWE